uniref:Putative secreted protein n=1 Tax=Panstrongylus lignarius TaxID=156445 RepID=A0A224XX76_9HEMI
MVSNMMLALPVLIVLFACSTLAQRSPYVPRPVDYPGVLNRFGSTSTPEPLDSRFGSVKPNVPGSLYDQETIDRVGTWPKDKRPFWYLNAQHIASHHGLSTGSPTASSSPLRGNSV